MTNPRESRLAGDLVAWDGKSAKAIAAVYEDHCEEADFVTSLIRLARRAELEVGATWLLKRHAECEGLEKRLGSKIYGLAPRLERWEARLHLLQLLPYLAVPRACLAVVSEFVEQCRESKKTFVRAWAYGGLCELMMQFPELEADVRPLIERAQREESASVKARIRRALSER